MPDDLPRRKSLFRQGQPIQLADGQTWMFPAPPRGEEWTSVTFGADYQGILEAILEVEGDCERRQAELAFAIFLLNHNYRLSPTDYERLLGSSTDSRDSSDWQLAFQHVAQDHLDAFLNYSGITSTDQPLQCTRGRLSRLVIWLRNHSPFRWFSVDIPA